VLGFVTLMMVIVFGEVGPKGLAVAHTEAVARLVAGPLTLFHGVVRPVSKVCVRLIGRFSDRLSRFAQDDVYVNADELKMLVEMAGKQEVLRGEAPTMMQDVVDLGQTRVKQIMTPRVDMSAFALDGSREEFLALVKRTHHKRYPLYRQTLDDISHFVRTRDVLLQPGKTVKDLAVPAAFVPETQTVEGLLRQLRDQKMGAMIVVDEYGGTAGMVTIEDVIEEVFGEIEDEYDEPAAEPRQVAADAYMLPGNLSLAAWRELFGQSLPELNVDTVGGLVTALLGRLPKVGDSARYRGLEFTVSAMRGRRVDKVRLRLTPQDRETRGEGKP